MATRWGKSRNSDRFYFLGLLNHCRCWLQPWNSKTLDPWNKSYDKLRQDISKQKYHFAKKCPDSQSMVFSVVMYRRETWTIKKAEHPKIDAFELWCWRRLLTLPWAARRLNQSKYSLEGLMLKPNSNTLATWYEEPAHWKRPWCRQRLRAGGEGDDKDDMVGWHHQLDEYEREQTLGGCEGQGSLVCWSSWGCKESNVS